MNVAQYTFQSPSPNQFQVGRPDANAPKADTTQDSSALIKSTNTSLTDAASFQATQTGEVTPTITPLLDVYA